MWAWPQAAMRGSGSWVGAEMRHREKHLGMSQGARPWGGVSFEVRIGGMQAAAVR